MPTLNEIANKYGTDKGDEHDEAHGYAVVYERLLKDLPANLKLLEIGIYDLRFPGASPRMWREYLPQAKLFGFDIHPDASKLEAELGMTVFLANQEDRVAQMKAMLEIGPVHFVVDDGSHRMAHICNSLLVIWPWVCKGGYYVVEDLHASIAQPRHYLDLLLKKHMPDPQ